MFKSKLCRGYTHSSINTLIYITKQSKKIEINLTNRKFDVGIEIMARKKDKPGIEIPGFI